ncbi:MAG: DUF6787 family protein [Bacteroidota bacterium]
MFDRLQKKWKVNGLQLLLILCTFAIGGSLTGYAGKRLMNSLGIEQKWLWVIIYIIVITILWPVAVLLVSVFFGQFRFFTGYLKKIGKRMGLVRQEKESRELGDESQELGDRSPETTTKSSNSK